MKELTTSTGISTGLFALSIPMNVCGFKAECNDIDNELCKEESWRLYSDEKYLYRFPHKIDIIGTITETQITGIFPDILTYSLLAFNGLHFVNPYGKVPPIVTTSKPTSKMEAWMQNDLRKSAINWKAVEDKIVNKLLIIKKLGNGK